MHLLYDNIFIGSLKVEKRNITLIRDRRRYFHLTPGFIWIKAKLKRRQQKAYIKKMVF